LAYSEILHDERKETASAFWQRANAFVRSAGITVTAVMTDNGSCYRSRDFAAALGDIRHRWTRPYRPQTNGKVERFNRTLVAEWAYSATTPATTLGQPRTTHDRITTITTDPTPVSTAKSPQPAFPTSRGRHPSSVTAG
jgi:transposase InsO family protein